VCDAFHYECWLNVCILVHIHSGEAALGCISDLYHTFLSYKHSTVKNIWNC